MTKIVRRMCESLAGGGFEFFMKMCNILTLDNLAICFKFWGPHRLLRSSTVPTMKLSAYK